MDVEEIRYLFRYTDWANAQVLDAAERLSAEELGRDLKNSFPSVRETLTHILFAEWVWLRRWKGESPRGWTGEPLDSADVAAIRERFDHFAREREKLLARLSDDALAQPVTYTNTKGEQWSYPLGEMMRHVVNHSTYHRGQVVTMLRQLGHGAPSTDLLIYVDEQSGGRTRVG